MAAQIEVFVDDEAGIEGVAIILRDASIVEHEGELVPGAKLTPFQALCLAHALNECAGRVCVTEIPPASKPYRCRECHRPLSVEEALYRGTDGAMRDHQGGLSGDAVFCRECAYRAL